MNWTEEDTYNALVAREVVGRIESVIYPVTKQVVYCYTYEWNGKENQQNFCVQDTPEFVHTGYRVKALVGPNGVVKFI